MTTRLTLHGLTLSLAAHPLIAVVVILAISLPASAQVVPDTSEATPPATPPTLGVSAPTPPLDEPDEERRALSTLVLAIVGAALGANLLCAWAYLRSENVARR